jgi:hypothetical protein
MFLIALLIRHPTISMSTAWIPSDASLALISSLTVRFCSYITPRHVTSGLFLDIVTAMGRVISCSQCYPRFLGDSDGSHNKSSPHCFIKSRRLSRFFCSCSIWKAGHGRFCLDANSFWCAYPALCRRYARHCLILGFRVDHKFGQMSLQVACISTPGRVCRFSLSLSVPVESASFRGV